MAEARSRGFRGDGGHGFFHTNRRFEDIARHGNILPGRRRSTPSDVKGVALVLLRDRGGDADSARFYQSSPSES
jgi:hypothetical protein